MQIFKTRMCNVTACRHSRLRSHWLMALVGDRGWGRSMYSAFAGNCSVCHLSFVYGRSLWVELNGGENSLHWKANMLPQFSIMTLCPRLSVAPPWTELYGFALGMQNSYWLLCDLLEWKNKTSNTNKYINAATMN